MAEPPEPQTFDDAKKMDDPSSFSDTLDDNITVVTDPNPQMSLTAVLGYCKRKILNPYLRLLSVVGLRPLISTHMETCFWAVQFLNYFYALQIVALLVMGYALQYMACFRRDRGFCFMAEMAQVYKHICHAPFLYSFVVPSVLHLAGYLSALVIMRHSDDDQLPVLMERVFISSTNLSRGPWKQRKIIRTLWIFVGFTVVWMGLSLVSICFMMGNGTITFKWLETNSHIKHGVPQGSVLGPTIVVKALKILLVVCTMWHDVVQATIVSNYGLQTELLTIYLQFLQEKLLQHPVQPLEWIRHIETFKKLLRYINSRVAPSVCIFTFVNISYAISGLLWLFNFDDVDKETVPIFGISILNIALWLSLALAPFVQASRLSGECDSLRSVGQEVRTRPFVHQDTPRDDLDSILLYTASLKLRARLFCVPVTGKYLCLFFVLVGICVLVLGQCHFFTPN